MNNEIIKLPTKGSFFKYLEYKNKLKEVKINIKLSVSWLFIHETYKPKINPEKVNIK